MIKKYTDHFLLMQLFVISGIFGFIYEEIFYYFDLGYIVKRGSTYGPWIPIYAFGGILIYILCKKYEKKPILVFMLGTIISGLLELSTGYILNRYFNIRLWDYNTEILNFGNIGGYICLRSVLFFGISSLLLMYIIIPIINRINTKNIKIINIISIVLFVIFICDIIINIII